MKIYYRRKASNIVHLFDLCFLENQIFVLLFWLAFYFNKIGYGYSSTAIAIAYPISIVLGSFVFNPLIAKLSRYTRLITTSLLSLAFFSFFGILFLGSEEYELYIYIGLVGFGCFFYIAPYSRSISC